MKKLLDLGKSFLKGFISILRIFIYLITIIFLLPATLITTIDKICSGEWNEVKLKYKFLKEAVKFIFNNIDNPILITNITELKSTKTVEGQTKTNILSYVKVGPFGSKKETILNYENKIEEE